MKRHMHNFLVVIGSFTLILLLKAGFLFFLMGLLPTLTAFLMDDTKNKDFYKSVRACNLAGMLPTLESMVGHQYPGAALQITMSDPMTWLLVYGAAATGWVLVWVCRWISYGFLMTTASTRLMLLERTKNQLVDEWGEEITQAS